MSDCENANSTSEIQILCPVDVPEPGTLCARREDGMCRRDATRNMSNAFVEEGSIPRGALDCRFFQTPILSQPGLSRMEWQLAPGFA